MNTPKLNIAFKALSLIFGTFLIVLSFLFGAFSLCEGFNMFNPYADTEFAKDYSPEKFKEVKEGMHLGKVISITGEPLNVSYDTAKAELIHTYTQDGYLRRKGGMKLSFCADFAWYGSTVRYNGDSVAVKVYSGWHYD